MRRNSSCSTVASSLAASASIALQAGLVAVGLATSRTARCCRRGCRSGGRWCRPRLEQLLLAAQFLGALGFVPDVGVFERGVDLVQPQRLCDRSQRYPRELLGRGGSDRRGGADGVDVFDVHGVLSVGAAVSKGVDFRHAAARARSRAAATRRPGAPGSRITPKWVVRRSGRFCQKTVSGWRSHSGLRNGARPMLLLVIP